MSLAARGAFIAMLGHQFANGAVPDDSRTICRIIGAFPDEWEAISGEVLPKFEKTEAGLVNARMEKERKERDEIRGKRIDAIQKRWSKDTNEDTNVSTKEDTHVDTSSSTSSSSSLPSGEPKGVAPLDPTLNEIRGYAQRNQISQEIADSFFNSMEAVQWVDRGGRHIKRPEPALIEYARRWRDVESRKPNGSGSHRQPIPTQPVEKEYVFEAPSAKRARLEAERLNDPSAGTGFAR